MGSASPSRNVAGIGVASAGMVFVALPEEKSFRGMAANDTEALQDNEIVQATGTNVEAVKMEGSEVRSRDRMYRVRRL